MQLRQASAARHNYPKKKKNRKKRNRNRKILMNYLEKQTPRVSAVLRWMGGGFNTKLGI